ncbi:hypothetical protein BO99DRAFT_36042 [Aspergillus violaceofuscus CBS 115571]|uniref:Uncharacterized protein n=1 Tax=Aspergillus violaceofuscus (strain CBS 115571) TaxID=1450538 RepID=A0A2V5GY13_ASPV1|nr:hypothetical protein BO99DRAFT_36042 [Aspergillus violaceofuscus CBS 115571]
MAVVTYSPVPINLVLWTEYSSRIQSGLFYISWTVQVTYPTIFYCSVIVRMLISIEPRLSAILDPTPPDLGNQVWTGRDAFSRAGVPPSKDGGAS